MPPNETGAARSRRPRKPPARDPQRVADRAEAARLSLTTLPPATAKLARQLAAAAALEQRAEEAWQETDAATTAVVSVCRANGLTWAVIAAILGLAESNVIAKYKPRLETADG